MPDPTGHHRLRNYRFSMRAHWYMLTTVTSGRRPLFTDPACADIVADTFRHYHDTGRVHGFAWVVMPNHIHWVIQLRVGSLSWLMRGFKTWTATRVRRMCSHSISRVWMPAFHDRLVRETESVARYIEYVVLNPVRAGLVAHPKDYQWVYGESEWLDVAGAEPPPVDVIEATRKLPWM